MADGRKNNGGHSTKGRAGRPKKADEQRIRDLVSPYRDEVISTVVEIMRNAEKDADRLAAAKLMLAYDFGQPTQQVNANIKSETPIFTPIDLDVPEWDHTATQKARFMGNGSHQIWRARYGRRCGTR